MVSESFDPERERSDLVDALVWLTWLGALVRLRQLKTKSPELWGAFWALTAQLGHPPMPLGLGDGR